MRMERKAGKILLISRIKLENIVQMRGENNAGKEEEVGRQEWMD